MFEPGIHDASYHRARNSSMWYGCPYGCLIVCSFLRRKNGILQGRQKSIDSEKAPTGVRRLEWLRVRRLVWLPLRVFEQLSRFARWLRHCFGLFRRELKNRHFTIPTSNNRISSMWWPLQGVRNALWLPLRVFERPRSLRSLGLRTSAPRRQRNPTRCA